MDLLFEVNYQISKKELKTIAKIEGVVFKIICGILGYLLIPTGLLNIFFFHHLAIGIMMIAFVLYCFKCAMGYTKFFFEHEVQNLWTEGNRGVLRFYADYFSRERKGKTETFYYKSISAWRTRDGNLLLSNGETYFLVRRKNIMAKGQQRDFDYFIRSKSGRRIKRTKYVIEEGEPESFPSDEWIEEKITNGNPKYSCRFPYSKKDTFNMVMIYLKSFKGFQFFFLFFFLYNVYVLMLAYPNDVVYNGIFAFLFLCAFLFLLAIPIYIIRRVEKDMLEKECKNLKRGPCEIDFYDQDIGFTHGKNFSPYVQIRKVIRRHKKCCAIVGGMPLIIKAEGMTKGSYSELYQFLKEICKANQRNKV